MTVLGLDPRINPVIFIGWSLARIASFEIGCAVDDGRVKPGQNGGRESVFSAAGTNV
jgi:hypothetical protein